MDPESVSLDARMWIARQRTHRFAPSAEDRLTLANLAAVELALCEGDTELLAVTDACRRSHITVLQATELARQIDLHLGWRLTRILCEDPAATPDSVS